MKLLHMTINCVAKVNDEELLTMLSSDNRGVIFEMMSMDDNVEFRTEEVDEMPEGAQVIDWTHS